MTDAVSTTNSTLRLKLQAAEEENKQLGIMGEMIDGLRAELFAAKERLTHAHQLLEKAGLLDQLPAAPVEREQENDSRTRQAERGFTR